MKYFKNTELAKLYNVSEKSVRNWVQAAQDGKLELQLTKEKNRNYILNTVKNTQLIEQLVKKGKKYKNSRGSKNLKPTPSFYELYNSKQILDIISNLDVYREIPYQYTYFDGGAKYWDLYSKKLLSEKSPNSLTSTIDLLEINQKQLDTLIADFKNVNVIDIGVGNGYPVKELITHLLGTGKLKRYVGVDLSKDIFEIAENNFKEWFGDKIKFEKHVRDIIYERFDDLLTEDSYQKDPLATINIVLFLGGTISNLRDPAQSLRIINSSMGRNDLFILTRRLDTEKTRRHFDFSVDSQSITLAAQDKFLLDLLNIDQAFYDVEQIFDPEKKSRVIQVRLKVDVSITFEFGGYEKYLEINKGESILLWRSKHDRLTDIVDQFDDNSFSVLQTSKSKNQEYLLLMSKIKTS